MGYMSAPMWLALILSGVVLAFTGHDGAGAGSDEAGGGGLFLLTALIVMTPKWLAALLWAAGRLPGWSRHPRFVAGILVEAVLAVLIAPIMMVNQTLAIMSTLTGFDAGWRPQVRDRNTVTLSDVAGQYVVHFVVGSGLLIAALLCDPMLAAWTAPVALSLMLAAPITCMLAQAPHPRSALWRVMSTPEEVEPPSVVRAARRAVLRFGGLRAVRPSGIAVPAAVPAALPVRPVELEIPQAGG